MSRSISTARFSRTTRLKSPRESSSCDSGPGTSRLRRHGADAVRRDVLEIGCGYGAMLDVPRAEGHRPIGVELSFKAAEFCRTKSLTVVAARCSDLAFRPGG